MIIRPNAGFILSTPRFVDVGMPKTLVTAAGRYMLIKRNAWGTEIERTPWFDNILLNSGLNRWATGNIVLGAAIGTGTSTPLATQTQLDTLTHYTTTNGTGGGISALGSSPYNNTRTVVKRTALGALNGNYSEVGVGWASTMLLSRALILDGGGSPTSISVSLVQQLDIVYQWSVYPPTVDTGPATVTISGVNYDVTGRAASVNSTTTWSVPNGALNGIIGGFNRSGPATTLGAITSSPASTTAAVGESRSVAAYSDLSYTLSCTVSWPLGVANHTGGIGTVSLDWPIGSFQYAFSPAIPKDATKTLALQHLFSWAARP